MEAFCTKASDYLWGPHSDSESESEEEVPTSDEESEDYDPDPPAPRVRRTRKEMEATRRSERNVAPDATAHDVTARHADGTSAGLVRENGHELTMDERHLHRRRGYWEASGLDNGVHRESMGSK